MPATRRKPTRHYYTVHITRYKDRETREAIESGEELLMSPEQLGGSLVYGGTSERLAAWHFYRAVVNSASDPLAFLVVLYKDRQKLIEHRL